MDILVRAVGVTGHRARVVVLDQAEGLNTADAPLLDQVLRLDSPTNVLHRLLTHPNSTIATAAALEFADAQPFGPTLPDAWKDDWRAAGMSSVHASARARSRGNRVAISVICSATSWIRATSSAAPCAPRDLGPAIRSDSRKPAASPGHRSSNQQHPPACPVPPGSHVEKLSASRNAVLLIAALTHVDWITGIPRSTGATLTSRWVSCRFCRRKSGSSQCLRPRPANSHVRRGRGEPAGRPRSRRVGAAISG